VDFFVGRFVLAEGVMATGGEGGEMKVILLLAIKMPELGAHLKYFFLHQF
jgi:hypothetical protein